MIDWIIPVIVSFTAQPNDLCYRKASRPHVFCASCVPTVVTPYAIALVHLTEPISSKYVRIVQRQSRSLQAAADSHQCASSKRVLFDAHLSYLRRSGRRDHSTVDADGGRVPHMCFGSVYFAALEEDSTHSPNTCQAQKDVHPDHGEKSRSHDSAEKIV